VLGMNRGETIVVVVIVLFVVSANLWPRLGAWLATRGPGTGTGPDSEPKAEPKTERER
jgi:hypothetical protein